MPLDADGWAKIITATFSGIKDLLLGLKEVALAVGVILGVMYGADNSSKLKDQGAKLDQAAVKADTAANVASEVKHALAVTTIDRDRRLDVVHADVAAVKAEITKDPEDMNTARLAKLRVEEHATAPPLLPSSPPK